MNSLGIYVHIPFCASKCDYCDFYSYRAGRSEKKDYAKALKKRITEAGVFVKNHLIDSIYFGGGTPTSLGAKTLCDILAAILAHNVKDGAEISLEANPGTVDEEKLLTLREGGFNRISFGMQSAIKEELHALGRTHSHEDTVLAVRSAEAAGFDNISLDIMLGLPNQTVESLKKTLDAALTLPLQHISAYCLKVELGTPLALRQKLEIPSEDEIATLYEFCCETLEKAGFLHYEISNFALPGFLCAHNMKYWKLCQYLGFGPGAHSLFDNKRFYFERDTAAYADYVGFDALHGALEEEFDAQSEEIMLSLRLSEGISKERLQSFGAASRDIMVFLEELVKTGYAKRTSDGWRLSRQGFLISNTIITQILDILIK